MQDSLVKHVHDSVRNHQVRCDDFHGIDIHVSILDCYLDVCPLLGLQAHSILQHRTVVDGSWDDVVLEHGFEFGGRGVLSELGGTSEGGRSVGNEVSDIVQIKNLIHICRAATQIPIGI